MIDGCKKVLHDFRYMVFLTGLQVPIAVLPYAAASNLSHVASERALSEPCSLIGKGIPTR
jgi:hypothetical protein